MCTLFTLYSHQAVILPPVRSVNNKFQVDSFSILYFAGWSLGEHQEWSKYSNFEVAVRVPLMFYVPDLTYPYSDNLFKYNDPLKWKRSKSPALNNYSGNQELYLKFHERNFRPKKKYNKSSYAMSVEPEHHLKNIKQMALHTRDSGLVSEALVELVDIFPTLAELAGLAVPPTCPVDSHNILLCSEGSSLVPVLKTISASNKEGSLHKKKDLSHWKKAVFSQYPRPSVEPQANSDKPHLKDIRIMGYSMRTNKYRYTEWVGFNPSTFRMDWSKLFGVELYLHNTDSDEINNVAYLPEFSELRHFLSADLHKGWRNALPT